MPLHRVRYASNAPSTHHLLDPKGHYVEHYAELAAYVVARRKSLNMTQQQVLDAGGPDRTTQRKIEHITTTPPRKNTLEAYDRVLRLTSGSMSMLLYSGTPPTPLEETTPSEDLQWIHERIRNARDLQESGDYERSTNELRVLDTQVAEAISSAKRAQLEAKRREEADFLTSVLEEKRFLPRPLAGPFGHFMETEGLRSHTPEYIDVLYRRWLVGESDELPASRIGEFEQRLRAAEERMK